MRTLEPEGSEPLNAFSDEYLRLLRELDDTATALEAELAGPWKIAQVGTRWGIFRQWERPEKGHRAQAEFLDRATAQRFLVVWSVLGREPVYQERETPAGLEVLVSGRTGGWLPRSQAEVMAGANLVEQIVRSPAVMALLLETAGPQAQELVGQALGMSQSGEE